MVVKNYTPKNVLRGQRKVPNTRRSYAGLKTALTVVLSALGLCVYDIASSKVEDLAERTKQGTEFAETINPVQNRQERQKPLQTSNIETSVQNAQAGNQAYDRNYSTRNLENENETYLLARMVYGEARGESKNEQIAVAYVALNRLKEKRFGNNLKEVLLQPHQFSCFNRNDVNRTKLMNPEAETFEQCLEVARGVLSGKYKDNTNGATHYFNPKQANPRWAGGMQRTNTPSYLEHRFYKER